MHEPFCDALSVTMPLEYREEARSSCALLLGELGASQVDEGYWQVPPLCINAEGRCVLDLAAARWQKLGAVHFKKIGQVFQVAASGSTLRSMRAAGLYLHWLSILASYPIRVTRLDATKFLSGPAAPRVQALWAHVREHGLKLTRKRTPPSGCRYFQRMALYAEGVETGSVYVANYGKADVCLKVYDKRNEVMDKGGDDPGDGCQVEFTFNGEIGCTLRDAAVPAALFWNYAGQLLDVPPDQVSWLRGDTGFDLPALPPLDPVVQITRACERNQGLRTVIRLSDSLGFKRAHLWGYMNTAHPVGALA